MALQRTYCTGSPSGFRGRAIRVAGGDETVSLGPLVQKNPSAGSGTPSENMFIVSSGGFSTVTLHYPVYKSSTLIHSRVGHYIPALSLGS